MRGQMEMEEGGRDFATVEVPCSTTRDVAGEWLSDPRFLRSADSRKALEALDLH
jgi:hypothetical protein